MNINIIQVAILSDRQVTLFSPFEIWIYATISLVFLCNRRTVNLSDTSKCETTQPVVAIQDAEIDNEVLVRSLLGGTD